MALKIFLERFFRSTAGVELGDGGSAVGVQEGGRGGGAADVQEGGRGGAQHIGRGVVDQEPAADALLEESRHRRRRIS